MSAQLARLADELRPMQIAVPAVAAVGLSVAALTWALDNTTYDTWAGVLILLALVLVSIPILRWMIVRETDPRIARLLPIAFGLKMLGALARFAADFGLYEGGADAQLYHRVGAELAPLFRRLDFSQPSGIGTGTGFIVDVTGWLYAFTGPTKLGAFFVFSWFGFFGLYFFYRAFVVAVPEGDKLRYAQLVFLLPSLLFWASGLGKDSFMSFVLGIAALGAARAYARQRAGIPLLMVGVVGAAAVRPHVAALLMISAFIGYILRRAPVGASLLSPLAKLGGVLFLSVALLLSVATAEDFLGIDDTESEDESVSEVLDRTRRNTSQGGSQFIETENTDLSPSAFPTALVSVLFRPFPWEAGNVQGLVAAIEGTALLTLTLVSWRRVVGGLRGALRRPYVLLCCVYSVVFIYAFSSFANFGILTRQRVQLLPFFLVLLALPAWRREHGSWRSLLVDEPTTSDEMPARREIVRT